MVGNGGKWWEMVGNGGDEEILQVDVHGDICRHKHAHALCLFLPARPPSLSLSRTHHAADPRRGGAELGQPARRVGRGPAGEPGPRVRPVPRLHLRT
jgi:hypothetical protein